MTGPSPLRPPALVDMLGVEEVDARILAACAELERLQSELAATLAEAEALEQVVGTPHDEPSYEFVSTRLSRFVDELRAEASAEFESVLCAAGLPIAPIRAASRPATVAALPVATSSPIPVPIEIAEAVELSAELVDLRGDELLGDTDLEQRFWADLDREHADGHLWRTLRAVGLQAAAVLLVIAVVLMRVG